MAATACVRPHPVCSAATRRVARRKSAPGSEISVPLAKLLTGICLRGGGRFQSGSRGQHSSPTHQPGRRALFGAGGQHPAVPHRVGHDRQRSSRRAMPMTPGVRRDSSRPARDWGSTTGSRNRITRKPKSNGFPHAGRRAFSGARSLVRNCASGT